MLNPREELNSQFSGASKEYRKKNSKELDKFWGDCGWNFKITTPGSETDGPHFYYNLVLGLDPRGMAGKYSAEDLASCINKALN